MLKKLATLATLTFAVAACSGDGDALSLGGPSNNYARMPNPSVESGQSLAGDMTAFDRTDPPQLERHTQ